jgi:hypothetical protein
VPIGTARVTPLPQQCAGRSTGHRFYRQDDLDPTDQHTAPTTPLHGTQTRSVHSRHEPGRAGPGGLKPSGHAGSRLGVSPPSTGYYAERRAAQPRLDPTPGCR